MWIIRFRNGDSDVFDKTLLGDLTQLSSHEKNSASKKACLIVMTTQKK